MTSLLDTATTLEALCAATHRAAIGRRHEPEVARFLMDRERECLGLGRALRLPPEHPDAWRPGPARRHSIRDPKPRVITVVPFPDRVVHHALCAAIEPALERYAITDSYACRKGRGQHAAVARVQRFAAAAPWALKADIASYFASIDHDRLLALLRRRVADAPLVERIERIVRAEQLASAPGKGLPIGALTSQHLANLYLGRLDHWLKDDLGRRRYVRYMDDFVVFGERDELAALLPKLRAFLESELALRLNERRSRLQPTRDGVPFLGLRVYPNLVRVRPDRWRRFRHRHAALEQAFAAGAITEDELAARVASQFQHFAHFDTWRLRCNHLARLPSLRAKREASRLEPGLRGESGMGLHRPGPRLSRRLLELEPRERAGREPQPERPLEPRRQPGVSRGELSTEVAPALVAGDRPSWPDGGGPRIAALCPGADPAHVQRLFAPSGEGTEAPRPGGGLRTLEVVAGPTILSEGR